MPQKLQLINAIKGQIEGKNILSNAQLMSHSSSRDKQTILAQDPA